MIPGIIRRSNIEVIIIAISLLSLFTSCYKETTLPSILHEEEKEETFKSDDEPKSEDEDTQEDEPKSEEYEWLNKLVSPELRGRKTGTEGSKKACLIICEELNKMGYTPIIEEFIFNDSIMMRNVIVEIPGVTDSIIVVGAHYDGAVSSVAYPAADDNASGVVCVLSIAKQIEADGDTILLCFWDGEESTEGKTFNGSSYFVKHFDRSNQIKCYCNIDCCGRNGVPIYLYYSQNLKQFFLSYTKYYQTPLEILKKVNDLNASDYVPFKNKSIPFFGWGDYDLYNYIHTPEDTKNHISVDKIKEVADVTISILNHL